MNINSIPIVGQHRQVKKYVTTDIEEIDGKKKLTKDQIYEFISEWVDVVNYCEINNAYYVGMDPYILSGQRSDGSFKDRKLYNVTSAAGYVNSDGESFGPPDWRIPVPYAAKIIDTMVGYMYKPGNIQYSTDDKYLSYLQQLQYVNKLNDAKIKNSELGIDQSINGISFEIIHTDGTDNATPIYSKTSLKNSIPVYDNELDSKLVAFIYFHKNGKNGTNIRVYYNWGYNIFELNDDAFIDKSEIDYFFGEVPVAVYKNNKEDISDFDRVKSLIDAYDYFMSDNINELERFAQAYLVLVNSRVKAGEEHKVKENRVISLNESGEASFLTKTVNSQHMEIMARLLREEIHKQSHIVDFTDERFGGSLSGAALDRLLLDMNNLSNTKQIYYEKGMLTRLRLLGKLILTPTSEIPEIDINMTRNVPTDLLAQADFLMKTNNILSAKTRFENTQIVKNVDQEIKQINEELQLQDNAIDTEILNKKGA